MFGTLCTKNQMVLKKLQYIFSFFQEKEMSDKNYLYYEILQFDENSGKMKIR